MMIIVILFSIMFLTIINIFLLLFLIYNNKSIRYLPIFICNQIINIINKIKTCEKWMLLISFKVYLQTHAVLW